MKKIQLTKGYVALVDDEDFERINAFNWYASVESRGTKVYAVRWLPRVGTGRPKRRMHYEVLGLSPADIHPLIVDHVNNNSLDNRKRIGKKIQLEIITQRENMLRSRGWKRKGVPWL